MPESRSCTPLVAAPCTSTAALPDPHLPRLIVVAPLCMPCLPCRTRTCALVQCRPHSSVPLVHSRALHQLSPGSVAFRAPTACPSAAVSIAGHCPCPGLAVPCRGSAEPWSGLCVSHAMPLYHLVTTDMVRTRGGSCLRPRVRFRTPEQADQAPASAVVPDPVPEEPQRFRRYQTRMGPRAPSPVPQR